MKDLVVWQYRFPSLEGEGWAHVLLREDGFFAAVSDYGNYAYLWTHHGHRDFREFFLRVDVDYLCSKLSERKLDAEASFQNVREHICQGRRDGTYGRERARALYDSTTDEDIDWEWYLRYGETPSDAWEFAAMRYPADVTQFCRTIVCGRLRAAVREHLERDRAALEAFLNQPGAPVELPKESQ